MVSVLSKNKKYASILQEVVYLEPHQPADYNNPSGVNGVQISSPEDIIASKNFLSGYSQVPIPTGWAKGQTSFSRIRGVSQFILNNTYKGDNLRGHSVGTNLDEIIKYFRNLGITVNVK